MYDIKRDVIGNVVADMELRTQRYDLDGRPASAAITREITAKVRRTAYVGADRVLRAVAFWLALQEAYKTGFADGELATYDNTDNHATYGL